MTKSLMLSALIAAVASVVSAQVRPEGGPDAACQILDNPVKPIYRIGVSHVPASRFSGYGESSMVEIEADWYFAQLMDIGYGDVDLNMELDLILWGHSAGLHMPDQLLELALDAGWTWRYANGMGFQIRAMPGIYSDMEELSSEMFYMPFSFAVVHAFDPALSGIAGAVVRPSFNRVVMPMIGVEWEVSDAWRVQARIPESRVTWFADPCFSVHLGMEWRNTTFALRERGRFDREEISLEDYRAYIGAAYRYSDQLELTGDIGTIFGRNVEFEDDAHAFDGEIDISSDMFVRLGIVGPF